MRIEKRLPFGFVGDWGKLYKRYTFEDTVSIKEGEIITYEKNNYRDIGQDVQFKHVQDTDGSDEQPIRGVIINVEYTTAETTDAYFDNSKRCYMCVVNVGDLVKVFGRLWIVTGMKTVCKRNPGEQKFFYCDLKSIL